MKGPGCPRCRMDLIRVTRETKLPRFTLSTGEEWSLPQCVQHLDGSLRIGGGEVPLGSYVIVERDHKRTDHNGLPCPGDRPNPNPRIPS